MKNYIFILCLAVSLSACQTTVKTDKAKVKLPGDVSIEVDDRNNHDFCPPGHKKKNWC